VGRAAGSRVYLVLEGSETRVEVLAGLVDLGGRAVAFRHQLVRAVIHVLQLGLGRGQIALKCGKLALRRC
jgi:hypothetical protein